MDKDGFKYLSQEFDSEVLDLVEQNEFNPYEYINAFEKFKEKLPSKLFSFTVGRKVKKNYW